MKSATHLIAFILLLAFLSGCIQRESPQSTSDELSKKLTPEKETPISTSGRVQIGVLQSLTGDLSSGGLPIVDSIKLAASEINSNGGILGKQIDLAIEDDQTLNIAAIDATERLIKMNRVPVIIGATGSGPSMSIIDITNKNGVLQISSSNTGIEFTAHDDQDLYFRTCASDASQAIAVAKLAKQKGFNTASTIVVNNPYGAGYEDIFIKTFESFGGRLLLSLRYDPTQTIFEEEVKKLSSVHPDFVLLVSYPETGSLILKTAYQNGLLDDATWLLSEGLDIDKVADMVGKDANGAFIVAGLGGIAPYQDIGRPAYQAFRDKFAKEYSREPAIYCSNSYDAMALIALAMEEAKSAKGTAIRDHLRSVASPPGLEVSDLGEAQDLIRKGKEINYQGASGDITFDEHGDVNGTYCTWSFDDNASILLGDIIIY